MSRSLNVHLLPQLFTPKDVAGGIVVMVDVLRASTTMTVALANGAAGVMPCVSVEEARAYRESCSESRVLLGGERGGLKIDGFDFGNSPRHYSADAVAGKILAFTTTNGTKALHHSQQADQILIGCFCNLTAVVKFLSTSLLDVHIVCAGTNGEISSEDVLFAGCLAEALLATDSGTYNFSDATRIAIDHWANSCGSTDFEPLHQAIRKSLGGRNLIALEYDQDIRFVAQVDLVRMLPCQAADGLLIPSIKQS